MNIWLFVMAIAAAAVLISLGSMSVWVVVLGLAAKTLLAVVLALVLGIVGYGVWRIYRRHRYTSNRRLIFKKD